MRFHLPSCATRGFPLLLLMGLLGVSGRLGATLVKIGPIEVNQRDNHSQELVSVGHDVIVEAGETNSDVVVVLGNAEIRGTVTRDLVVVLGTLKIAATANIARDIVLIGGQMEVEPGAKYKDRFAPKIVLPTWLLNGVSAWLKQGILWGRPLPHQPGLSWWVALAFLGLNLLVVLLVPKPIDACVKSLEESPASTFLAGILAFLLFSPLTVLLAVTVVGVIVIPLLSCALAAASLLGKVSVYRFAGQQIGTQLGIGFLRSPFVAVINGTLLLYLFYMLPILGFIIWSLVGTFGLGSAVLAAFQALSREKAAGPDTRVPVSASNLPPLSADSASSAANTDVALLPRAGFWMRFAATLADLFLVGAIVAFLRQHHPQQIFLAVWFTYHLIMWTWKGTTLGGLIFGLKIVRSSGEPITFGVALVRALAAFFSALVLFLGFFWVGWTREKRSWHDIIAGTVIVRYPKGTSLI